MKEDASVIAIGQMVAMENLTCIARLVQFKVVAVAMQPRFHHIHHLNEVTVVGQRCAVGCQCKMAERVEACASPSTERAHFPRHFQSCDEGRSIK